MLKKYLKILSLLALAFIALARTATESQISAQEAYRIVRQATVDLPKAFEDTPQLLAQTFPGWIDKDWLDKDWLDKDNWDADSDQPHLDGDASESKKKGLQSAGIQNTGQQHTPQSSTPKDSVGLRHSYSVTSPNPLHHLECDEIDKKAAVTAFKNPKKSS
jgi:hypothetical protein